MFRTLQEILQPSQADKFQCKKCTKHRGNRELFTRTTQERGLYNEKETGSETNASKIQAWN